MAFTIKLTRQVDVDGDVYVKTHSITATAKAELNDAFADATTDGAVPFAVDVSTLKAFYAHSDQAVTIEVNNGTTPTATITLTADEAVEWSVNDSINDGTATWDDPLGTSDVTTLYITNSSGSTANLVVIAGYDATP